MANARSGSNVSAAPANAPTTSIRKTPLAATGGRWAAAGLVGFALVGGVAIFVGGTPYFERTAANDSALYNAVLVAAFGALALVLRRRPSLASYAACSRALFVAATAMLIMVIGPFNWLVTADDGSARHAVQDKLAQFLAVVPVILVLTWAARRPWRWIYLQQGRPKRWLIFGLSSFAILAIGVTVFAVWDGISSAALLSAAPWILVFAALNAVMEELWFRGIFLRPYSAAVGGAQAVVVTALIFGAAHIGATYISVGEHLLFASLVVALGLVLAWAMRWANALWGAVLFHMGLDLVVILELAESA